jgi:hypothetical protein
MVLLPSDGLPRSNSQLTQTSVGIEKVGVVSGILGIVRRPVDSNEGAFATETLIHSSLSGTPETCRRSTK